MFKIDTLKNGLTLITVPMPHLDSITTLVAVGAGSRYEVRENNGISHFLEHMFFKGSKKFPTAELISTMVDSIGAVNNAATSREYTYYWIKSAAKHLELSVDIISSMLKESLLLEDEISREKGVIIEESRMRKDSPRSYVWDLFEGMMYGDQPLGWDIVGPEKVIKSLEREDFIKILKNSLKNILEICQKGPSMDLRKLNWRSKGNLKLQSIIKTPIRPIWFWGFTAMTDMMIKGIQP
jgi:predicted Zn-dependent peptidase